MIRISKTVKINKPFPEPKHTDMGRRWIAECPPMRFEFLVNVVNFPMHGPATASIRSCGPVTIDEIVVSPDWIYAWAEKWGKPPTIEDRVAALERQVAHHQRLFIDRVR